MHPTCNQNQLRLKNHSFVESRQLFRQVIRQWHVTKANRHDTSAQQPKTPSGLSKNADKTASKGFGSSKGNSPADSSQVVQKQLKSKQRVSKPGGQIDVVQVQDCGTGDPQQLGDLKIQTVERLYGSTNSEKPQQQQSSMKSAVQEDAEGQASAHHSDTGLAETKQIGSNSKSNARAPGFYQTLCQEMAMAEKRGAMAVAGPPPPPFQLWSFTPARYLAYLTDCITVHQALEAALATNTADRTSPDITQQQQPDQATGQAGSSVLQSVIQRLSLSGLGRAEALQHDIFILSKLHPQSIPPGPCQTARSHADQIHKLGRDVQWLSQTAQDSSCNGKTLSIAASHHKSSRTQSTAIGASNEQQEAVQTGSRAAASLLAHAFAVYTLHAAGGMRFGAVAAENLELLQLDAAHFYRSYASNVQEPLRTLQIIFDEAGERMDELQKQAVISMIPDAVRSASMLLSALAHTD